MIKSYNLELLARLDSLINRDAFDDQIQNNELYKGVVSGSPVLLRELNDVCQRFPNGWTGRFVLDVGCGSGFTFDQLPFITHGVEPNEVKFQNACAKGKPVEQGFCENIPFTSNFFDCVIVWGVLCFVRSLVESLIECNRVLKVGGYLVVDTVSSTILPMAQTVDELSFCRYTRSFGFEVVERLRFCEPTTPRHYRVGFVLEKVQDFVEDMLLAPFVVGGTINNFLEDRDWFMK